MAESDDPVSIERRGQAGWCVLVRRHDGSLLTVARNLPRARADLTAAQYRRALADAEPWALRLVDVSAGELRS